MTVRGDLLNDARLAVEGDRNKDYGSASANFGRTAALWNAYHDLQIDEVANFTGYTAKDVAVFMILVKVARLSESDSRDTWQDIAGYAACGYETVAGDEPNGYTTESDDADAVDTLGRPFMTGDTVRDRDGDVWTMDSNYLWGHGDMRRRPYDELLNRFGPLRLVA